MNSSNQQNRRADINEQLSPPDRSPDGKETGGRRIALPIIAPFVILLSCAVAVLFLLPEQKTEQTARTQLTIKQESAPLQKTDVITPDEPDDSARTDSAEAATAREKALSLKVDADSQNIVVWGEDTYHLISDNFTQADGLLNQQDFSSARERYLQIAADLQELLDSKPQRFKEAIEAGQRALLDEQPDEARAQFSLALALDSSSQEAQTGMVKAEQLPSLLSTYQQALSLEEAGKLEEAVNELKNLLALDNSYEPALRARERIQNQLDLRIFQSDMNSMLAAIERGDFRSAQKTLQSLQASSINQQQVEQAQQLLREKEKLTFIESGREVADNYKQKEQWKQARDTYDKILARAPEAMFAVAGRKEADKRLKLDNALADTIGRPQRLQHKTQQKMATQLLVYAKQITPRGSKLQSQISSLETLLKTAATPVAVTLESDNQTDIAIYHVGRMGSFFTKQITLKPGTYTVVGSKVGYRDVRETLTIKADGNDYRLVIRCEEPI